MNALEVYEQSTAFYGGSVYPHQLRDVAMQDLVVRDTYTTMEDYVGSKGGVKFRKSSAAPLVSYPSYEQNSQASSLEMLNVAV